MAITIQKSSSGATFTVTDSNGIAQSYAVNTYNPYLFPDGVSITLYSIANPGYNHAGIPYSGLIINQSYTNIIDGDTGIAFTSQAAVNAYILANFFELAGGGGGGGITAAKFIIGEISSGAIDGSNTSYPLANPAQVVLGVIQNNLVLNPNTDYTYASQTVTLTTAPLLVNQFNIADTLFFNYIKQ